jgi:hypothetical protein
MEKLGMARFHQMQNKSHIWLMDHTNILLTGSIVFHEKENWDLQASFMVVVNHHLEILAMDGEASDLE